MSNQPACSRGVLTSGGESVLPERDQQEGLSSSLVSIDDGEIHGDLSGIPEPTPGQIYATSTPAKNLDLLTGMNITQFPDMSSSQTPKRKRVNPSPTTNAPTQHNDSGESLKQTAKRANNMVMLGDFAHSVGEHSKTISDTPTIIASPSIHAGPDEALVTLADPAANTVNSNEYIVYEESDLNWHSTGTMSLYTAFSASPFVVFIESTVSGLNLGKLDPIKVIDLLTPIVSGGKQVSRTGINQIKVECEHFQSANDLVSSAALRNGGYRMFIPDTFLYKRGFTDWFPPERSVRDIVRVSSPEELKNITCIKRLVRPPNIITNRVEFSFNSLTVPRFITVGGFSIQITPVIQRPRRCFRCQRFCHTKNQCRSTYPSCEHCSGRHLTDLCPYKELPPCCKNCKREHVASSNLCPIFKMEFGILKLRYTTNCNRSEAKAMFFAENPDLDGVIHSRNDSLIVAPPLPDGLVEPEPTYAASDKADPRGEELPSTSQQKTLNLSSLKLNLPPCTTEQLTAVDTLIALNRSNSDLLGTIQENLASPISQLRSLEDELNEYLNH
ncbi:uncharacterized protein LOC122505707 [Leptopilina heterotoma]|uniref:uncharacterized protein LOC122505707 n=1 Tax=Leptopilina heterotoma TaxID=63436 RepID=UPI001CA81EF9|nr:uncharacterized protein LOC122505707 [Leptopilina heterotoma]XP_043473427.1 uncharacterized protein LOC122505707 [Leptopilina heterotoma]